MKAPCMVLRTWMGRSTFWEMSLKSGEAGCKHIDHQHICHVVRCLLTTLQYRIGSSGDVESIKRHLAGLLLHPIQAGHDCLKPLDQRTEGLIGQDLVVLHEVQSATNRRLCDLSGLLWTQATLGLTIVPTKDRSSTPNHLRASSMPHLGPL